MSRDFYYFVIILYLQQNYVTYSVYGFLHQSFTTAAKIFSLQNIVKNLERQEVRDWLSSTKELLMEEKKVSIIIVIFNIII